MCSSDLASKVGAFAHDLSRRQELEGEMKAFLDF